MTVENSSPEVKAPENPSPPHPNPPQGLPFPINPVREAMLAKHRELYKRRLHQLAERDAALITNAVSTQPKCYFPLEVCQREYRHRYAIALKLVTRLSGTPILEDGHLKFTTTPERVTELLAKLGCRSISEFMLRYTNLMDVLPTDEAFKIRKAML